MKLFSTAKVNLFLDITGYDSTDGYHYIDSIFQEVSLYDEIEIYESDIDIIEFINLDIKENSTVHKALRLLKENFNIKDKYKIVVKKNIPVGAGLGGGSSNAAFVLKYFRDKYNLDNSKILEIAKKIGSDVPFFIYGGLCRVSGKGEKIEKLNSKLDKITFLVIYPDILVKTSWAYSLIEDKKSSFTLPDFKNISLITIDFLEKILYNKFQIFVFKALPELKVIYDTLTRSLNCKAIFMSGSGSSLVALYEDAYKALEDSVIVRDRFGFLANVCIAL